jgi:hypothetical protein
MEMSVGVCCLSVSEMSLRCSTWGAARHDPHYHVVGVAKENLPPGALRHPVYAVRHALACEVLQRQDSGVIDHIAFTRMCLDL